jgi:hypothetical protein
MAKKKKHERGSGNISSNPIQVVPTEPTKTILTTTTSSSVSKPSTDRLNYGDKDNVAFSTSKTTPEKTSSSNYATNTIGQSNVSSFGATPKNIISTSTVQNNNAAYKYEPPKSALTSSDRINPFDKNSSKNASIEPAVTPAYASLDKTDQLLSESTKSMSNTSLDDLTKNRFEKQQGVQNQQTGRYVDVTTTARVSFDSSSDKFSSYSSAASSIVKPIAKDITYTPENIAIKPTVSESKFSRTNSSDADIIFGGKTNMEKYKDKYSNRGSFNKEGALSSSPKQSFDRNNSNFTSSMSTDSDYIFGKRDDNSTFAKSLSLSSDKDGDFASDPTIGATSKRTYEGIQNVAFQDYDSPVVKPSSKPKWTTDDDDYDLK